MLTQNRNLTGRNRHKRLILVSALVLLLGAVGQNMAQLAFAGGTRVESNHTDIKMGPNGKAQNAVFTNGAKMVRSQNGMNQTIQAGTLNMGLDNGNLQASGGVTTHMSGDAKVGDVSIQSDSQVFEQDRNLMRAVGHVVVKKGDTVASSPEAVIFLGSSGAADKVMFIKGATLRQGEQQMTAETITIKLSTGDIYAERNASSTINGKDSAGKSTLIKIKSHLQEFDNQTGALISNGKVVLNYEDYIARGPKAVFYRKGGSLDHIVMTGRSQIEDADREVTGDTVTITVNPKRFNAQGNVTTFIKARKNAVASTSGAKGTSKSAPATKAVPHSAMDDELMMDQMNQEAPNAQ